MRNRCEFPVHMLFRRPLFTKGFSYLPAFVKTVVSVFSIDSIRPISPIKKSKTCADIIRGTALASLSYAGI
jgi:hypothetical protein